jgi:uncharacterized membrane protein YbhN (UPF0104 family)
MVLPYLKGLIIIKCDFSIFLCGSIVYSVFVVIIFVYQYLVLNKWYQSTFLGRHCGQIFFIFADFFFFGEEKRGSRHSRNFWYISVKNLQKQVVYLISSQKNTQVEKKNRLKRSPGSQDIEVLKSAIFQGFFRGRRRDFFFFYVASGG